jgi:hypothetical protein
MAMHQPRVQPPAPVLKVVPALGMWFLHLDSEMVDDGGSLLDAMPQAFLTHDSAVSAMVAAKYAEADFHLICSKEAKA